ncbi:MAG: LapA family protein [bacterium]|nr:LapA family protein [bacterium]
MIFLSIGLILGAVAVIFALQNLEVITVTFLAWQLDGSLAVILILAVTTGVLIGVLVSLPGAIRSSFHISSLRKQNVGLKEKLFNDEKELLDRNSRVVRENETVAGKNS